MPTRSSVRCCAAGVLLFAAIGCGSAPEDAASLGSTVMPISGTGAAPTAAAGTSAAVRMEPAKTVVPVSGGAGAAAAPSAAAGSSGAGVAISAAGSGGAPPAAGAAANSGGAGGAPTLTQIYEMIYTMKCAACHSMTPSDNQNGKLGMLRSKDQLYDVLVSKPAQGTMCMGKGTYIVPGKPEMSLLIQKLSAKPPCGVTMPLGGTLEPMLVEKLSAWIAAGALNN